jgi:hypothetical protein
MPEPLGHDLDGNTGFDEKGAVGVADVVEADLGEPARATILSNACEIDWGWIGLPSMSANTHPAGAITAAVRSAACHVLHADSTSTVVWSRSIARRELLVLADVGLG